MLKVNGQRSSPHPPFSDGEKGMRPATMELFAYCADSLKASHASLLHNIFQDSNKLNELLQNKNCLLYNTPEIIFLLIPLHNIYYDFLYMATDLEALHHNLLLFLRENGVPLPLRASIIGKEPYAGEAAEVFEQAGFSLGRRIARMRNLNDAKNMEKNVRYMREDSSQDESNVEFAVHGDEQDILDLLLSEFDIRSDNLPELSEIAANISRKQVLVIRKNARIVALHYFTRQNASVYGWYDVTRKEFRKNYLYQDMMLFLYKYWAKQNVVLRSYSWRDVANKRLMALARQCNQIQDGVYIYNMIFNNTFDNG